MQVFRVAPRRHAARVGGDLRERRGAQRSRKRRSRRRSRRSADAAISPAARRPPSARDGSRARPCSRSRCRSPSGCDQRLGEAEQRRRSRLRSARARARGSARARCPPRSMPRSMHASARTPCPSASRAERRSKRVANTGRSVPREAHACRGRVAARTASRGKRAQSRRAAAAPASPTRRARRARPAAPCGAFSVCSHLCPARRRRNAAPRALQAQVGRVVVDAVDAVCRRGAANGSSRGARAARAGVETELQLAFDVHGETRWGGRWDSNPQQPESQSGTLPLSYGHHRRTSKRLCGLPGGTRTHNPRLRRLVLYPVELRAAPEQRKLHNTWSGWRGFEPPTSCSQSKRATRLRHTPKKAANDTLSASSRATNLLAHRGAFLLQKRLLFFGLAEH